MKPILFNTDMIRAIQADRKTVTRRVVKPQPNRPFFNNVINPLDIGWYDRAPGALAKKIHCPYRLNDILYARETWQNGVCGTYLYKADAGLDMFMTPEGELVSDIPWRPSIHMPREAARIFLRVTDVRVERLQDITELQILEREGIQVDFPEPKPSYMSLAYTETRLKLAVRKAFADLWNRCFAEPRPVKGENGAIICYESYPWEDICETRTYRGKPWYVIGNPWVWSIEFERISREEAMQNEP